MPELHQPTYLHSSRLWRGWVRALAFTVLALMLPGGGTAVAKVSGPCSNCHTMHYSQNNSILAEWDEGGPHQALLTSDCVGCHTGENDGIGTPRVMSTGNPPVYNINENNVKVDNPTTLAGGSFYWVNQTTSGTPLGSSGGDAAGHNVLGISDPDTIGGPPGLEGTWWPADGQQVTCSGIYGCHGTRTEENQTRAIHGAHHGNLSGARTNPGDSPATGYRFLVGIAGYEDPDWEFEPDSDNHNQYKGADDPDAVNPGTISSLCARCHGAYHDGGGVGTSSPWLRHPTDYDMSDEGEYANYGGSGNAYVPAVPVASADVTAVKSIVNFTNDTIITCVTCHRAHGSPYYKAMRWNYAGSVNGGLCTECHSSKK